MNELQVISGVRCYEENGVAYLRLEDVARGLGFTTVAKSGNEAVRWARVHQYLDDINALGAVNDGYIPENIFYRLAMKAKNETAERFQALVADEIIPSIRKHGGYIAGQESMSDDELLAKALIVAQSKIAEKDKLIKEQQAKIIADKPKIDFFDAVAESKTAIEMGAVAKVLGIKGMGRNNLFEFLRKKNVLMNSNIPYQTFVDRGYFRIVETRYTKPNGDTAINIKTLVYQKGVDYIRRLVEEGR